MSSLGKYDSRLLDLVFGKGEGTTPAERARVSTRRFVRGLDLLTFDESSRATGRRLSALEALEAYSFDKLVEVATEGSAVICESTAAVGRVLRERRQDLRLTTRYVATAAGVRPEIIEALEASKRRPIREYERVARVLGLDERMLSYRGEPIGNQDVAVRMRTLHDERPALSGSVVAALSEAAWVAMTQLRMESALGLPGPEVTFEYEPFYGSANTPAYRVGYDLADRFREALGFADRPIDSMRELLEQRLRIPVIQAELGDRIAGATVASGDRRTIVVNLSGRNRNVYARRSTMAHELSHILFDPREQLRELRVDEYDELDRREDQIPDPVEQRANAFAVQLLAPRTVARRAYVGRPEDAVAKLVDAYGISFTAARYQMWNALDRRFPLTDLNINNPRVDPAWEAREAYTTTWHPIPSLVDHPSRAGRFSALTVRCAEKGFISWDTAAEWLLCSEEQLSQESVRSPIRELYPDLF
jgi:Zn-dependent peptidase ImmA (M78 family)